MHLCTHERRMCRLCGYLERCTDGDALLSCACFPDLCPCHRRRSEPLETAERLGAMFPLGSYERGQADMLRFLYAGGELHVAAFWRAVYGLANMYGLAPTTEWYAGEVLGVPVQVRRPPTWGVDGETESAFQARTGVRL